MSQARIGRSATCSPSRRSGGSGTIGVEPYPPSAMEYAIRRSDRARRIRVSVEGDGAVVVTLPRRTAARHADVAVLELGSWIARRQAVVAAERAAVAARGETVPYLGEVLELRGEPGRQRVHRADDVLLVPQDQAARRPALERWFRRQAAAELACRVPAACAALGVVHTGITVRAQKTRWGSCSARGGLSFNWRLLLAPPEILDYVVWHEACHLVELNHSPRFWALLDRHRPGYAAERAWLRRHGATLRLG